MKVDKKGVVRTVFRDSYNLVPRPLDDLVGAFNLGKLYGISQKLHFPHLWNTMANLYCPTLPHLPPKECYMPEGLKPAKLRKLNEFYEKE